jgi:predicted nuclease of predicted toxin-antitoxin system
MLRFFGDIHVPPRALAELQRLGVDVIRSLDAGFAQNALDKDLFSYATQEKRVMVTCDSDFIQLHQFYLEESKDHYGVVYFNMNNGECGDIGLIVKTLHFLAQIAISEDDMKNTLWRA